MVTILVQGRLTGPRMPELRARAAPDWRLLTWDPAVDAPEALAPLLAEAEILVGDPPPRPWPEAPKLRFYQLPWTGYDAFGPADVPSGVSVANTYEHETTIAEYVLGAMLEWQIGLRHMDARMRSKGWGARYSGDRPLHRELKGTALGVVGYGHIGREVALRARAFGVRTLGLRRSAVPCPPELDWLGRSGDLHELLGASDFVLVACDLNAETRGLIGEAELAAMKPDGVLINVARGPVVEEAPLYEALSARRIGGAVLDVWYNYGRETPGSAPPWPANHPFERLDNVIMSAHESANTDAMFARRWDFVAANIARFLTGAPPENVVFTGTGS